MINNRKTNQTPNKILTRNMRFQLALVAVVSCASASKLTHEKEMEFLAHAVKVNRNPQDVNEYQKRLSIYLVNDTMIKEGNVTLICIKMDECKAVH